MFQCNILRYYPIYSEDIQACTQIRNNSPPQNLSEAEPGLQDPRTRYNVKPTRGDSKENNLQMSYPFLSYSS